MPTITLDGVGKTYDRRSAPSVTDLDLTIEDGEFLCFLGPSGCGKSTTLRMIAGLEPLSTESSTTWPAACTSMPSIGVSGWSSRTTRSGRT
jgi:ABC-type Fe3+/spermidine/putrescine transport system ATPase subunit